MPSNDNPPIKPRIWTPLFVRILIANFLVSVASQCILTGTPIYLQMLGEPVAISGTVVTVYMIASMIFRTTCGALVDRFTRRIIMIIGSLFFVAGFLLPLISPSIPILVLAKVLHGCAFAGVHTAVTSSAADILPRERLGEGIGLANIGGTLGLTTGPLIAIWLTGFNTTLVYLLSLAALSVVLFFVGASIRYEKHPEALAPTSGYRMVWEKKRAILDGSAGLDAGGASTGILKSDQAEKPQRQKIKFFELAALAGGIPLLVQAVGTTIFTVYTAVYALGLGYGDVGLFFGIGAAVTLTIRFVFSKLFNTSRPRLLFLIPTFFFTFTLICIYFIHSEPVFFALGITYGIGVGFSVPLLNAVALKASPPENYAPANALFYLLYDAGTAISSFVWGLVIDYNGFQFVFLGGAACIVLSWVVGWFFFQSSMFSKKSSSATR